MATHKKVTLRGPGGLQLVLDPAQIFPDDPGQGTPAIVWLFGASATLSCAQHEGELEGRNGMRQLTPDQCDWLNSADVDNAVDAMFAADEAARKEGAR